MAPLAHAADVVSTLLFVVPMLVVLGALAWQKAKERRAGNAAAEEGADPTLDEIMDDRP